MTQTPISHSGQNVSLGAVECLVVCWLWGGLGGEFPQKFKFLSGIKMI